MAITTSTAAQAWRPDRSFFAAADVVPQALLMATSSIAGEVDGDQPAVRVAYVDDTESASYVAEGSEITEEQPGSQRNRRPHQKISRLIALSNEQYRQEKTANQLAHSVARDLVRKADNSYIADVSNPTGLINVVNTVSGGNVFDSLDNLVELIAGLERNGAVPSHIVLDPLGWASFRNSEDRNRLQPNPAGCWHRRRRPDAARPPGTQEQVHPGLSRSGDRPQRRRVRGRPSVHRNIRTRLVRQGFGPAACYLAHWLGRHPS